MKGSLVALVTPFNNNQLDVEALEKLISWHLDSGTNGLLVAGSTGEGNLLTEMERKILISTTVKMCQGKMQVSVGCGDLATWRALEQMEQAASLGADSSLIVNPYYIRSNNILEHFNVLSEANILPIIVYNNPARCNGFNLTCDEITALAAMKNIIGFKDSASELLRMAMLRQKLSADFLLLAGDDTFNLYSLAAGSDGWLGVAANAWPREHADAYKAWIAKDLETFESLHRDLVEKIYPLTKVSNPIAIKCILAKMGKIKNELRSPLYPIDSLDS